MNLLKPVGRGELFLRELREQAPEHIEPRVVSARSFMQITSPVSRRSAKTNGRKTRVLKLRNWQIYRGGFGDERIG